MSKLGQYLVDTKQFFFGRFGAICSVLFPALIPINLVYVLSLINLGPSSDATFLVFSISLALYPLYQGALILFIHREIQGGDSRSIGDLYQTVLPLWSSLIVMYAMVLIASAAGFALLVIPGLFIIARLSFTEFECLIHGKSPFEALQQSWRDTEENQFLLIVGLACIWAVTTLPVLFIQQAISYESLSGALAYFLLALLGSVITAPITIFRYRVYSLLKGV